MLPRSSYPPAAPRSPGSEQPRHRRHVTGPQATGLLLIALVCVVGAAWYVPRIASADSRLLTGTVTSNGIVDLNFARSGQVARIRVRPGEAVRKGQVLAIESAPAAEAVVTADRAAIAADQARLISLGAGPGPDSQAALASSRAQLAKDRAQLAIDRVRVIGTEIIAPSPGTVIAVNVHPGETVRPVGVPDYGAQSSAGPVAQPPSFSLLPEGPQPQVQARGSGTPALPVIALRTSGSWQVTVLVPETSISRIRTGQGVLISVPAARVRADRGRISELLPTPVYTAQGVAYQALVTVRGHQADQPLSGMTADVELV